MPPPSEMLRPAQPPQAFAKGSMGEAGLDCSLPISAEASSAGWKQPQQFSRSPPSQEQQTEAVAAAAKLEGPALDFRSRRNEQRIKGTKGQSKAEGSQSAPDCSSAEGLHVKWRVPMQDCVDASPLILVQPETADSVESEAQLDQQEFLRTDTPKSELQSQLQCGQRWWVFACSHGGNVIAVDGPSGETVWETSVPGRASAGIAIGNDHQVALTIAIVNIIMIVHC